MLLSAPCLAVRAPVGPILKSDPMTWLRKLFKFGLFLAILGVLVATISAVGAYFYIKPNLPDIGELRRIQLQVPLRIYSSDAQLIAEYGEKRRTPVSFDELPERMVQAFTAAEDSAFFSHPGVDIRGLARAGITLLLTGERKQGGSTITMQVARNFYLTRKKTYLRKLYEIFLALDIEQKLSKQEILELYVNKIYLGHRAYGVGAAARVYYGKTLAELDLPEIAMIAGLPKAPSAYNPVSNPPRAVARRNYVLGRMLDLGYINQEEHDAAVAAVVTAKRYAPDIEVEAPYVAEMVRSEIFSRHGEEAYTSGLEVYTTISANAQLAANQALRTALRDYSERHGYRGPIDQVEIPGDEADWDALLTAYPAVGELMPALVLATEDKTATAYVSGTGTVSIDWEGLDWARPYISSDRRGAAPKQASDVLARGDVVHLRRAQMAKGESFWHLSQMPRVSGALVSLRARDGATLALVGGYDFFSSKFNRATQALRQPGSGFKPIIYSAALENGFTAASLINDAPVVFNDPSLEGAWRPENYSGKFFGPTRLRYALTKSRNLVSIRLLRNIGIETVLDYASRFGFDPDRLPHNLSLALGSANVTPQQMARAYAVLANGGFLVEPYLIERIDQNGENVFQAQPVSACPECPYDRENDTLPLAGGEGQATRIISPQNRYLMYSMLQDVVQRGTAVRAKVLQREDIAGKTGTTNDQRDAWFNGFNQSVVTNVWVGFDDNGKLGRGEVGGKAALPAWIDYMRVVLEDTPDVSPEMPEGMVTARINPDTGQAAASDDPNAILEIFQEGTEPLPPMLSNGAAAPGVAPGGSVQPLDLF